MSITTELADKLLDISLRIRELKVVIIAEGAGNTEATADVIGGLTAISEAIGESVGLNDNSAEGTYIEVVPPVLGDKPADLVRTNFNRNATINFYGWWNGGSRYQRFQHHVVLSGTNVTAEIQVQNLYEGGGSRVPFQGTNYIVTIDGTTVATFSPLTPGVAEVVSVNLDLSNITPGYHIIDVTAFGTESAAAFPIYISGGSLPQWIPTVTGSFELGFGAFEHKTYRIMWVPAKFDPTFVALPINRTYQHFDIALPRSELNLEALVVHRGGNNVRRPHYAKNGEMTTQTKQWYTTWDMVGAVPKNPLVDGPRGRGALGYLMHLEVGTAAPVETGPINNIYGMTPWSIVKIRESGECKTLSGYRYKQPEGIGKYWEDVKAEDLEMVGIWDPSVPVERRRYHELWGMAWNKDSMISNETADRIPSERNLRPHADFYTNGVLRPAGIEMVVTNSQIGSVNLNKFSPISHTAPPVISELITGMNDPWDIVEYKDSYIISERKANRIVRYNKLGVFQETIVEGASGLATVNFSRLIDRHASMDLIRAQPVCLPEGLYIIKDNLDDWLYYASAAMAEVRRINLVTKEIQVVQSSASSDTSPSMFRKIAVSDGTFGPRGTIFISTWSVTNYGFPYAFLPDMFWPWDPAITDPPVEATRWSFVTGGSAGRPRGPGGVWESWGYTGAVGVGNGRLIGGGADEGIYEVTRKPAGAVSINSIQYTAGKKKWAAAGYDLTHGSGGYGYYGLPLPWGIDPDIDYYLTSNRHVRP